jgi:hypothetical protein
VIAGDEPDRRKRHRLVALHLHPPLDHAVRNALVEQPEGDRLGRVGEHVQVDLGVRRGGAGQHRTDQPRLERRQHSHGLDGGATQVGKVVVVGRGLEQALVLRQCVLDLGVLGQHGLVGYTEPLGCLALGEAVVVDAVLAHDAGRFLRQRAPQQVASHRSLRHGGLRHPARSRVTIQQIIW